MSEETQIKPEPDEVIVRKVSVFEYGTSGAVGIPKEIFDQFDFEVKGAAEWFVINTPFGKVVGLRPVSE